MVDVTNEGRSKDRSTWVIGVATALLRAGTKSYSMKSPFAVYAKRIRAAAPPSPSPTSRSDGLQSEKRCSRMINQPQRSVGTPVFSAGQDSILSLNVSVNETSRGSFSPPRRYSIPQRSSCIDSDTFAQQRGKELVWRAGCGHGGPDLGRVQTTGVQRSGGAVLSSSRCSGCFGGQAQRGRPLSVERLLHLYRASRKTD